MVQEAKCAIIEKLGDYDPLKSKPTTYFGPYIKNKAYVYNAKENYSTSYYESRKKELRPIIMKYEEEKVAYTYDDLVKESGLLLETVINTMARMEAGNAIEYIPNVTENAMSCEGFANSSEEICINKEKAEQILSILKKNADGKELIAFLLYCRIGEHEKGYMEIAKILKMPVKDVRCCVARVTARLRLNPYLNSLASNYYRGDRRIRRGQ